MLLMQQNIQIWYKNVYVEVTTSMSFYGCNCHVLSYRLPFVCILHCLLFLAFCLFFISIRVRALLKILNCKSSDTLQNAPIMLIIVHNQSLQNFLFLSWTKVKVLLKTGSDELATVVIGRWRITDIVISIIRYKRIGICK